MPRGGSLRRASFIVVEASLRYSALPGRAYAGAALHVARRVFRPEQRAMRQRESHGGSAWSSGVRARICRLWGDPAACAGPATTHKQRICPRLTPKAAYPDARGRDAPDSALMGRRMRGYAAFGVALMRTCRFWGGEGRMLCLWAAAAKAGT